MSSDDQVHALRAFNRFYTRRAGVVGPYLSQSLTLTDVRVLYELATDPTGQLVASDIARVMGVDAGYLSRILKRFETAGWVHRTPNPKDQRQSLLSLTAAGKEAYAPLNARSHADAAALLAALPPADRERLVGAMKTIEALIGDEDATTAPKTPTPAPTTTNPNNSVLIRNIRAGDLGWVLMAHGEEYTVNWGLNAAFEAVVAGVIAECSRLDPAKERGWVAEVGGQRAGCIFLMSSSIPGVARIRLLLLTPLARGKGLGSRLVDECVKFAREKGYTAIELWTQSVLTAARAIYAKRGFVRIDETPSTEYGQELMSETWRLEL
jgi:DNA-binding MarR family transcriptional regulator/GNAT superfamily N-acetyltransferase